MSIRIALRIDEQLAESVRAAASSARVDFSDWVRRALRREAIRDLARRARAHEDEHGGLYTDDEESALAADRARRHVAHEHRR
jgi:hypothetical protein